MPAVLSSTYRPLCLIKLVIYNSPPDLIILNNCFRIAKQVIFDLEMLKKLHKLLMWKVLVLVLLQIIASFLHKLQMLEAQSVHKRQSMKMRNLV